MFAEEAAQGRSYDHAVRGELDSLPEPQVAFVSCYRARAPEYGVTVRVDEISGPELLAGLKEFPPRGEVLQLACGSGMWIRVLAQRASQVTAIDPSPKALKVAAWRIRDEPIRDRVRFEEGDIFAWEPDQRYDVAFFSACLSYVPPKQFGRFWEFVADCLKPAGRVFFIDQLPLAAAQERALPEALAPTMEQFLKTGERYRAIKVFYEPDELQDRLAQLGWRVEIHPVGPRLFYAEGTRATASSSTAPG